MNISLFSLFIEFCKIGLQLLGGGYVIIPLLQHSIVENKKWITQNELLDYYSISQCVPGLIAANVSVLIGHKTRGILGGLFALLGIVFPSFIIILIIASVFMSINEIKMLQDAFWGVRISVLLLIILTVKELIAVGIKDKFSKILYMLIALAMLLSDISPVILIIIGGLAGVIYTKYKKNEI